MAKSKLNMIKDKLKSIDLIIKNLKKYKDEIQFIVGTMEYEKKKKEEKNNVELNCPKCKSADIRSRSRTKDKWCRRCGHIWVVKK